LSSEQATKANRLIMAISQLRDMSHCPAPETSIMEILAEEACDLLDGAGGFHFSEYDEFAERIELV